MKKKIIEIAGVFAFCLAVLSICAAEKMSSVQKSPFPTLSLNKLSGKDMLEVFRENLLKKRINLINNTDLNIDFHVGDPINRTFTLPGGHEKLNLLFCGQEDACIENIMIKTNKINAGFSPYSFSNIQAMKGALLFFKSNLKKKVFNVIIHSPEKENEGVGLVLDFPNKIEKRFSVVVTEA